MQNVPIFYTRAEHTCLENRFGSTLKAENIYCKRAIISRGLYIFYPIFEVNFFVFKDFFLENSVLCMACIQERLVIKSGLWWRAYGNSSVNGHLFNFFFLVTKNSDESTKVNSIKKDYRLIAKLPPK